MKRRAIYYDTETTGIRSGTDRIIEIAAYDADLDRSFCEFINPGIPIPAEATAVHHITDEMVREAKGFDEVGAAFTKFCGEDAILIAHNNDAFDKKFLEAEFSRNNLTLPESWGWVDSLKWSRKYRSDLPRHSLQILREVYGIEANNAHRAFDDVMVLYRVFAQMIDDLHIEKVLELLSVESALTRMPFGKHQGKAIKDVPKSYVRWLAENGALDKDENAELKKSFESHGLLETATT